MEALGYAHRAVLTEGEAREGRRALESRGFELEISSGVLIRNMSGQTSKRTIDEPPSVAKEQRSQGQIPSHHHLSLSLLYVPAFCLTCFSSPAPRRRGHAVFLVSVFEYKKKVSFDSTHADTSKHLLPHTTPERSPRALIVECAFAPRLPSQFMCMLHPNSNSTQ